jgi:hypothetical protein
MNSNDNSNSTKQANTSRVTHIEKIAGLQVSVCYISHMRHSSISDDLCNFACTRIATCAPPTPNLQWRLLQPRPCCGYYSRAQRAPAKNMTQASIDALKYVGRESGQARFQLEDPVKRTIVHVSSEYAIHALYA